MGSSGGRGISTVRCTTLERVARDEPGALTALVGRYRPLVRHIVRERSPPNTDVDAIVQDVFVSAWLSAPRFDPRLGTELVFVATIARRRAIEHHRRLRRVESLPTTGLTADTHRLSADDTHLLRERLLELPENQREVLLLAFAHGMSHAQIAHSTGLPIGTVKSRLRTALATLREHFV